MKIVVGLGNPGSRYAETRHNAGFRVLARLAGRRGLSFTRHEDARVAIGRLPDGEPFALLEPLTFMNRSGGPTAAHFASLGGRGRVDHGLEQDRPASCQGRGGPVML